jgi:hypothetical protein
MQVFADHLFRAGRFDSGQALLQEAGLQGEAERLAAPFHAMHKVLTQVRGGPQGFSFFQGFQGL